MDKKGEIMINQQKLAKKIKQLRAGLGLSQQEFAQKIGLSRVAVSQLEIGKRGLEALEMAKIAKTFGVSVDFLLQDDSEQSIEKRRKIRRNKEFKTNSNKLQNVILYILNKCGGKPNVGETVLYKLLYFVDFDSYELSGKPVTGMNYVKLQFGPVPRACDYDLIIKEMIDDDKLKIINQKYHNMLQKRYIALTEPDISVLSSQEIKVIDEVIAKLSDMNARQIENYVHEDVPWQATEDNEIISYILAFDRTAPYAHRDYDQDWQDAAGNDSLKELGEMSKEEYNYYMNL